MASPAVVDSDLSIDFLRSCAASCAGVGIVKALITTFGLRHFLSPGDDFLALVHLGPSRSLRRRRCEASAALSRQGRPIGLADGRQAGLCLRHGLALATRNRKHFGRVDGPELSDSDDQ